MWADIGKETNDCHYYTDDHVLSVWGGKTM
jgi:hypothetical protein